MPIDLVTKLRAYVKYAPIGPTGPIPPVPPTPFPGELIPNVAFIITDGGVPRSDDYWKTYWSSEIITTDGDSNEQGEYNFTITTPKGEITEWGLQVFLIGYDDDSSVLWLNPDYEIKSVRVFEPVKGIWQYMLTEDPDPAASVQNTFEDLGIDQRNGMRKYKTITGTANILRLCLRREVKDG